MNWYRKQYWLDCSKMYMCTSTRLSGHSVCRENFYFSQRNFSCHYFRNSSEA
uniref:Uncharacterized protein n=1 Tax=Anguilla anguilla TaxID=7936 RepID=A0A0E9U5P0_ANGAN